jgi:hypothetical protein
MRNADPIERWISDRRRIAPSPEFADSVMARIRSLPGPRGNASPPARAPRHRLAAALAVATGTVLVVVCQTVLVAAIVVALSGVAS